MSQAESRRYVGATKRMWNCKCDCGKSGIVAGPALRSGKSKSCGCLHRENMSKSSFRHGLIATAAYRASLAAYHRCTNPKCNVFSSYGGRGIEFRFQSVPKMAQWIIDNLGTRPIGFSLDRIDNNGHYEMGNLRWASRSLQRKNVRRNITSCSNEQIRQEVERRGGFVLFDEEVRESINAEI